MSEWVAEIEWTVEQAAGLAGRPLTPFAYGWDKTVFRDGDLLVAFCRRGVAVQGMRREAAVLPRIAGALPLPVPVPQDVRTYGAEQWPWWSMPLLAGTELGLTPGEDRESLARDVGRFLRALHALPPPLDLPVDPLNRSDATRRAVLARERLARLGVDPPTSLTTTLGPSDHPPVLSHGDLHLRHVLVDGQRASGVIDWGDVCLADPCLDLSLAYSGFQDASRAALLHEYGTVDAEREERARVLAVFLCSALAEQAAALGDEALYSGALEGIRRTER